MLSGIKTGFSKLNISYESTYYYSALIFAFTLPVSRAAISFFILWFIVLFISQRNYHQAWIQIKNIPALKVFSFFIAFLFLSFLWSEETAIALKQMRLYGYWIIIPILAVKLKKEWVPNIITAFLLGMFLSEIIAYGIFFELWSFNGRTPDYPAPFMSHIHYSLFLATTAIILLNRMLSKNYSLRTKIPMTLFFLTSVGNLFISTGRTGQLAFLIAMAVAVVIHYRVSIKAFILFLLLSTFLFYGGYHTVPLLQERIDMAVSDMKKLQDGNFVSSWGYRAAFWVISYDIVKEHPLLGVGVGDYYDAAKETLEHDDHNFHKSVKDWCISTHFHNQYLMILVQTGIIGFSLMIWLFVTLLRLDIQDKEVKELSMLTVTVFIVSCIAEPMWILQFPIILFVFISSISLAASKKSIA